MALTLRAMLTRDPSSPLGVDGIEPADQAHAVGAPENDRAERLRERLAIPVLIAALASVPAVFLTLLDNPARIAGAMLNALSGAVLVAETAVLFAVSDQRLRWLKDNRYLVGLAILMIPAVAFAAGPVQLLRLVRLVGALRILRVTRIFKAGRILRERAKLDKRWERLVSGGITLLVAAFVAAVLSDPTSHSRRILDGAFAWLGVTGAVMAGAVLGIATYVVRTSRKTRDTNR